MKKLKVWQVTRTCSKMAISQLTSKLKANKIETINTEDKHQVSSKVTFKFKPTMKMMIFKRNILKKTTRRILKILIRRWTDLRRYFPIEFSNSTSMSYRSTV